MTKMLALKDFREQAATGKHPRSGVAIEFKLAPANDTELETDDRVVTFVFSDDSVDLYGDTIDAKGWSWDESGAGTVVLFGHDSSSVDNVIGRAHNIRIEGRRLLGDIHFATADVNPVAERVYRLVKAGIINSVSVGFKPIDYSLTKDKSRPGGVDFRKQKLLEISIAPVPANENAVALAKAFGIDLKSLGGLRTEVILPQISINAPEGLDTGKINEEIRRALDHMSKVQPFHMASIGSRRSSPTLVTKDLYDVGWLAELLQSLGYLESCIEWEAEWDDAPPPAYLDQITAGLKLLGQALIDMTTEEVAKLLGEETAEESKAACFLRRAASKGQVRTMVRAGKTISSATEKCIKDACGKIMEGHDALMALMTEPEAAEASPDEPDDTIEEKEAAELRARRAKALKRRLALAA